MDTLDFRDAIVAAIENGDRLVEDARSMLDWERLPSSFALALLAQEEYAKALLLSLIQAKAIAWSDDVRLVECAHHPPFAIGASAQISREISAGFHPGGSH